MATLYTQQDKNIRKTWILFSLFLIVVIGIGWAFSWIYQIPEILYFAVIFSIFMNFFSYWYSDKIVLKISGATPALRETHREIYNVVENLSITAGLPVPKIYIINDPAPNAFAAGRDKNHAVVAVTSGLLEMLDRSELEGVIAHELSHIGNRDILISTVIVVLVGFVALLSDIFLRFSLFGGSGRSRDREGRHQSIMMIVGIVFAILAPLVVALIQLSISRKREFLADASGALLTRYPEGLASALVKISKYPGSVKRVSNATAHLFIASPFGPKEKRPFLGSLFMTHPPVEERVKALIGEKL
ncbi:MAG: M48 family metallopeptidase [Parcubacteria group bacterium]|nr:M48 family metallopeptidase [Parcubacteria group bacterium]MCR4342284.1 M48 family metallopeptidase [Patescibacteria group bacterium]